MLGPRTHIYRHAQSTISRQTSVSNINSRTLNYVSLISLFSLVVKYLPTAVLATYKKEPALSSRWILL